MIRRLPILFLGVMTFLLVACTTAQPSSPRTFYLALNTSSPELMEMSTTALELTSELTRADDRLVVDQVRGNQLDNIFSATPTEEIFQVLIDGLTTIPSTDEALVLALKRARDLARDLKEHNALTAIVISPGTAEPVTLHHVHTVMEQFKTNGTDLHVIGVTPTVRLPFSTAFQPARAFTKVSSTTDEFSSQFNSQGY